MKISLKSGGDMKIIATNARGLETGFDTVPEYGGHASAPTPMEIMLEAMCACSFMDVVSIIRKKRLTVKDLIVRAEGKRADTHPKVIEKVDIVYELHSPDAQMKDLERAIELSHSTYCGASAMFRRSGCEVNWTAEIVKE